MRSATEWNTCIGEKRPRQRPPARTDLTAPLVESPFVRRIVGERKRNLFCPLLLGHSHLDRGRFDRLEQVDQQGFGAGATPGVGQLSNPINSTSSWLMATVLGTAQLIGQRPGRT